MTLDTHSSSRLVNLDPWQLGYLPPGINFEFAADGGAAAPDGGGVAVIDAGATAPDAGGAVAPEGGAVVPPDGGGAAAPDYLTAEHPAFRTILSVSEQLGSALAEAREREAEAAQAAQTDGSGLPELDFTDPQSVIAHANHHAEQRMTAMIGEALEPFQQYLPIIQSMARGEGQKLTSEMLEQHGIPEQIGEGENIAKPREIATQLAAALMRGGVQPEEAVNQAAAQVKQLLGISGSAAVDEHIDRATGLRKAVPAPGAGTSLVEDGGAENRDPLRPSRYTDAVTKALSAQQPR